MQTGSEDVANVLVKTAHQNYEGYTKKEIIQSKEARWVMGMIGNPIEQDFKGMVRRNIIHNLPCNRQSDY